MKQINNDFKIDWGEIITELVIKKDLDTYENSDCWEEDYDWTEFDLEIIEDYYNELIDWGEVFLTYDRYKDLDFKRIDIKNDLKKYKRHLKETEGENKNDNKIL